MVEPTHGPRVCAIVVTFNRKDVLGVCLRALLNQTRRVDQIVIVDNASSDGTGEWLRHEGYLDHPQVTYLQLSENRGGAGGFHEGFKYALAAGADWFWAMDDDGYPQTTTLAELLGAEDAGPFRGPLVLACEDPANETLAFPNMVVTDGEPVFLQARAQAGALATNDLLSGYICAFNGVLVSRSAVERIGLPNPGFFIWGDEWDFVFRARKLGISTITVISALFWHPANRAKYGKLRLGRATWDVPIADTPFRNYLLIRNHAYIARQHRGILSWVRHVLKYFIYFSLHPLPLSPLQTLQYSMEGFRGQLTGHQAFLNPPNERSSSRSP